MILADKIGKYFSSNKQEPDHRVFWDMSFYVEKEEIVGLVGRNGAGKTTLLKVITGLLKVDSGRIWVLGKEPCLNIAQNRRDIGVLFSGCSQLWYNMRVRDCLELCKSMYHISDKQYQEILSFVGKQLELPLFFNTLVSELSFGARMRSDFLYTILPLPKILILDEPTIGLDLNAKEIIMNILQWLNKEYHTTIIISSHDIQSIEKVCNRVMVIDHGKQIFDGKLSRMMSVYASVCHMKLRLYEKFIDFEDLPILSYSFNGEILEICFDTKKIEKQALIRYILARGTILDMQVIQTSLEEMLMKLYE